MVLESFIGITRIFMSSRSIAQTGFESAPNATVSILDLQGLPEKGDISGWIAAGGTQSDLLDLIEDTPLFQPGALDAEARTASDAAADGAQGDHCVGASGHSHGKARRRREGNPWSSERGKAMLEKVADIQTKPIDWHWPGWLARGKLHLLAGTKTTGKSAIALRLMATTTRSAEWPDGTEAPMGDTLIWSAEDDAEDTIKPRFLAGGDPGRFNIIRKMRLPNGSMIPFDPSIHLAELKEAARALPELKMVVIDPVVMVIPGDADSHKNTETRRGLQPLVDFAEDLRAALIGFTHFSKGTKDLDPIERVSGSLAFTAIPRVILGAWMDPETDERHLMRIASNIGPTGNGFSNELYEAPLAEHDFGALHLRWIEALRGSPEELLKPNPLTNGDKVDSALDEATAFLKNYLGLGPKPSEDVKKAAVADRVIQRVIAEAARTMRTDKYEEFAVALCERRPPPWACAERERIWRRIDQGRKERGTARAA
jgi:putative DNA primase/helicase